MENILAKVLTSSVDPNRMSLMVRGMLLSIAPMAMVVLGITEADFGGLVDGVVRFIFLVTSLVGAFQTVYGAIRKIKMGRWSHPYA